MIRLANASLPSVAENQLTQYQNDINAIPNYVDQIEKAEQEFSRRNKTTNPTFRSVRAALKSMCCDFARCHYCEDAIANRVEHYRPKSLYPEYTFSWENFLYTCDVCNGPGVKGGYRFLSIDLIRLWILLGVARLCAAAVI